MAEIGIKGGEKLAELGDCLRRHRLGDRVHGSAFGLEVGEQPDITDGREHAVIAGAGDVVVASAP